MEKIKPFVTMTILGIFLFTMSFLCWIHPAEEFSLSERRKLAKMPKLSAETIVNGSFMKNFETYSQDQFPARESMRSVAAFFSMEILQKKDNHDIYVENSSFAKLDYPLNETSIEYASKRFGLVYEKYLNRDNCNVFLSVVPDKGYFLAKENGYPAMDYGRLCSLLIEEMPYAEYIDIFDTLDADCYYKTDPHWSQEKIYGTAKTIAEALGVSVSGSYKEASLDVDYKGNYAGQSAIKTESETINYVTNAILDNCVVTNYESNTVGGIYDFDKGNGRDPYEFFLSGPVSLLKIENPTVKNGKKLIVFRDSFGSSIVPYLSEGYNETWLVDIRYLAPEYLDKFLEFDGADVLFIYSTSVLNHSETIK